jgi:hypothetical protein
MMNKRTFTGYVFAIGLSIGLVITSVALGNSNLAFKAGQTSGTVFSYTLTAGQVSGKSKTFVNGSGAATATLSFYADQTGASSFTATKDKDFNFKPEAAVDFTIQDIAFTDPSGSSSWTLTWYDKDWNDSSSVTSDSYGQLGSDVAVDIPSAAEISWLPAGFSFTPSDADLTFTAITITFVCN